MKNSSLNLHMQQTPTLKLMFLDFAVILKTMDRTDEHVSRKLITQCWSINFDSYSHYFSLN